MFNSATEASIEVVNARTGEKGAHVCIEAAGAPATYRNALGSVGREGCVVLLGNPAADVTLPASLISQLMRREVSIFGTWNSDYSAAGNDDDWAYCTPSDCLWYADAHALNYTQSAAG